MGKGAEAKLGARVAVHYDAKWKGITFQTSRCPEPLCPSAIPVAASFLPGLG